MNIAEHIGRHERIALMFSGGKDSLVMLHVLKPWWGRLTVYWVNTGAAFPETVKLMESIKQMVPHFKEIQGNQPETIARFGWPSDVVPMSCTEAGRNILGRTQQPLQHRFDCCWRSLMLPAHEAMIRDGITLVLRGKRHDDADHTGVKNGDATCGYTVLFPIHDWTRDDVHRYLEDNGIEKPAFYRHIDDSLDCMTCSAWWGEGLSTYLKHEYPVQYIEYSAKINTIKRLVLDELNNCEV